MEGHGNSMLCDGRIVFIRKELIILRKQGGLTCEKRKETCEKSALFKDLHVSSMPM